MYTWLTQIEKLKLPKKPRSKLIITNDHDFKKKRERHCQLCVSKIVCSYIFKYICRRWYKYAYEKIRLSWVLYKNYTKTLIKVNWSGIETVFLFFGLNASSSSWSAHLRNIYTARLARQHCYHIRNNSILSRSWKKT